MTVLFMALKIPHLRHLVYQMERIAKFHMQIWQIIIIEALDALQICKNKYDKMRILGMMLKHVI